jgi:fructose-bisphosphate aldolase class II
MPLVSMRQLLDHAAENGYGLPAFNVNNLEQVQAIMAAGGSDQRPVIMQASAGARKYAGEPFLRTSDRSRHRVAIRIFRS